MPHYCATESVSVAVATAADEYDDDDESDAIYDLDLSALPDQSAADSDELQEVEEHQEL